MKRAIILVACLFGFAGSLFAAEVTISMDPNIPRPNSTVTLKLVSYDIDVDVSMVTWKINGKEIKKGVGEKYLSVALGDAETSVNVSATVADPAGNIVQSAMTVRPQTVTLLWETTESYVPPFYEGKPLPAAGAKIRAVVLGKGGVPLSYTWFDEGTLIDSASGANRNQFIFNLDPLVDATDIKVRVKDTSGSIAEESLSIQPHEVMPVLYQYDSLLGVDLTKPLIRRAELQGDITLSLEPWYLSTNGLESTASYSWYVDGLPVTPEENTVLSLRPKENSYGVRNLTVVAEQAKRRLQKAEDTLQIVFDTRK